MLVKLNIKIKYIKSNNNTKADILSKKSEL